QHRLELSPNRRKLLFTIQPHPFTPSTTLRVSRSSSPNHSVHADCRRVDDRSAREVTCMRWSFVLATFLLIAPLAHAQVPSATLRIEVRHDQMPVAEVKVLVSGMTHTTDAEGVVVVTVPPGRAEIVVVKDGFAPLTTSVSVAAGEQRDVIVELPPIFREEVTVSATRTDKRLEDQPLRVEVL